jgi:hypothetical protein
VSQENTRKTDVGMIFVAFFLLFCVGELWALILYLATSMLDTTIFDVASGGWMEMMAACGAIMLLSAVACMGTVTRKASRRDEDSQ